MSAIKIANAPSSWGVMKGFESEAPLPAYQQVLDEIAESGYEGTELGDWGFMPADARLLSPELERRGLDLIGALVPLRLADTSAHEAGIATAVRTAKLLASCAGGARNRAGPFIILADENGADPNRTQMAGRVGPGDGFTPEQWRYFSRGAEKVARAVLEETGVRTVFHHHCAGFVETPAETDRFLDSTREELIGLCFDSGHYAYAGGDPVEVLRRYGSRVWHVHFKDCHLDLAEQARSEGWDYFRAVRNGIFFGLGDGAIDFPSLLEELRGLNYSGWIVVEDELPPGMGIPLDRARLDRDYLRRLGL